MIIDSHLHLWRLSRGDYDWLTPDATALYRDFLPSDLLPEFAAAGVAGGVAVQAAPTSAETLFLLDLAEAEPALFGVVGWTDLGDPRAPEVIAGLARRPKLKGLRPMLQDLPDDDYILAPALTRGLRAMQETGLAFDALVRPRHLRRLVQLRQSHPALTIIIDHAGKPEIANGGWRPWAADLAAVAADGMTYCKLSGLVTEAGTDWRVDDLRRYIDYVLEAFGPARILWGSDWPVLLSASAYRRWLDACRLCLEDLTELERGLVFAGAARRAYNI